MEIGGSGRYMLEPNGASPALMHATAATREGSTLVFGQTHMKLGFRVVVQHCLLRQARG
jgi:hypothetical protein